MDAGMGSRAKAASASRTGATGSDSRTQRSGQAQHELLEKCNTRQTRANRLYTVGARLQESAHAAHEIGHLLAELLQAASRGGGCKVPIGLRARQWGRRRQVVELNFGARIERATCTYRNLGIKLAYIY